MEINELSHPDSVWTWKSTQRKNKVSLWLPYMEKIEKLPKGAGDKYMFVYKGGNITAHLKEIDFIMFYGASGNINLEFLDKLNTYKIPLMIHRRNMPNPYVFYPTSVNDDKDILTSQILARENKIKACYIARTLIRERIRHFEKFFTCGKFVGKLKKARSLEEIRNIEAFLTKAYWKRFYSRIGHHNIERRKDDKHPINEALNAGSYFFFGIMLRWVLFHKLSPHHGFLHEPTSYSALIYDLIEPYRYIIEDIVAEETIITPESSLKSLTAFTFTKIKEKFEQVVYVPQTHQEVRLKNLLHGIVLSLRSYLNGETKRFVIPTEGIKKGGRPLKLSFKLPGSK